MTGNRLLWLLQNNSVLMADGATGTNLFEMRLVSGDLPELWNDTHPERIEKLHQDFVDAGSDIILTNSFGGSRHRLKLHQCQDRVHELNQKAAEIARKVADGADREILVAGSVGPTGELLVPLGALTVEAAEQAFLEQMEGLKDGGVDLFWIETMSAPDEMVAAAKAAAKTGLPYVVTASFDTAGKTMMGLAPSSLPPVFDGVSAKPSAIGANCGVGASDLLSSILDITEADPSAIVVAKANCGIPLVKGDSVEYSGTPELMSEYARLAMDAGAKIIGGCCGTSCEHLKAMRSAIDAHKNQANPVRPQVHEIVERIGPMVNAVAGKAVPKRERGGRRGRPKS